MTWFDYAVLTVLGLSLALSLFRGLTREVVSIIGWISAFVLAVAFGGTLARHLPESLGPLLGSVIAFLLLFVGVLLLAGFAGLLLSMAVRAAGFGVADRLMGGAFGLVRGLVIVLVAVLLGGLTPLPKEPFWRASLLAGPFETAVLALRPLLPEGLAQRVRYR